MPAPVFTLDNLADHVAAYRARIDQRRAAIESRAPEKRFALTEPSQESKEFWEAVRAAIAKGQPSRPDTDRTFQPFGAQADPRQMTADEALARNGERALTKLGRDYIEAARRGDAALVRAFMEEGFPVAWRDPRDGETALHAAAGSQARPAIRALVQHWPDFLIRDRDRRLASELAFVYGDDPALAHFLRIKERRDAIATGRQVSRRDR